MPWVVNKPRFWIWHGCICKGYAEFQICQIMAPYASSMPEYTSVCLSVPQFAWSWLNIAERPWVCLTITINCSDYPRYNYNNSIILVTNVTILEFLSARFVHPRALLPFFNTSQGIRITKARKLLMNFSFWLQWRQSFQCI